MESSPSSPSPAVTGMTGKTPTAVKRSSLRLHLKPYDVLSGVSSSSSPTTGSSCVSSGLPPSVIITSSSSSPTSCKSLPLKRDQRRSRPFFICDIMNTMGNSNSNKDEMQSPHVRGHLYSSLTDVPSPFKSPSLRSPSCENSPSCILPFLFLGDKSDAMDVEKLRTLKISHILSVMNQGNTPGNNSSLLIDDQVSSSSLGQEEQSSLKYKRLQVEDSAKQNILQFFDEAFHFIEDARRSASRVLIHCQAGISRSPTIAIAYLMRHLNLSFSEAFQLVKSKRSIIEPGMGFQIQLIEFEKSLGRSIGHNNNNSPKQSSPSKAFTSLSPSGRSSISCLFPDSISALSSSPVIPAIPSPSRESITA